MSNSKLTIADLFAAKKDRVQLTEVYTECPVEAAAAEAAGIDILVTPKEFVSDIRVAAPNTFLVLGSVNDPEQADESGAISAGFKALEAGGDAVYSSLSPTLVAAMAREHIPVIGHVGYVPYRSSWFGGARAVGKTSAEAMQVFERSLAYQDAGAIAVEMEIVPSAVAEEIAKRLDILIISMGSGSGGDVQYLFATDILGTNEGHVPRHAKVYAELNSELKKLQQLRVDAFGAFHNDVRQGNYPAQQHVIDVDEQVLADFLSQLDDSKKG